MALKLHASLTLAALGLVAHPATAQTTIYNFQLNASQVTYTGAGALGNNGKATSFFNTGTTVTNAEDSNGNGSGVGLTVGSEPTYDQGYYANSNEAGALLQGYIYNQTQTSDPFTLSGLNNYIGDTYTLDLYGINGAFANSGGTIFTVNGATNSPQTVTPIDRITSYDNGFRIQQNYAMFTGTVTSSTLTGSFVGATSEGDFNGLQIGFTPSAAPEPSQWAGLGFTALGTLGLAWKARKRKASTTV